MTTLLALVLGAVGLYYLLSGFAILGWAVLEFVRELLGLDSE